MIKRILVNLRKIQFGLQRFNTNEDTHVEPEKLGLLPRPYKPTYRFHGSFINEGHEALSKSRLKDGILVDLGIDGWLRVPDALKLYELAYYSVGNILELGTYMGLSTTIMSAAVRDSGYNKEILSVDLLQEHLSIAERNLVDRGLYKNIQLHCSDATSFCNRLIDQGERFSFIFIDHSHEYQPVAEVCRLLEKLVSVRGFCLFHDFNDPRNYDPMNEDYGVAQAVYDHLPTDRFEFYGIFGCAALYRARW